MMACLVDDPAGSEAGNEPENYPRGQRHPDLQQLRESSNAKERRASRDRLTAYLRIRTGSVRRRTQAAVTPAVTASRVAHPSRHAG